MLIHPKDWVVALMDFVDDFRFYRNPDALMDRFPLSDEKLDAMLASTAEYLCGETGLEPPQWVEDVPVVSQPWFVSGLESLKAIALVESPVQFRRRKIFVLENFLSRA